MRLREIDHVQIFLLVHQNVAQVEIPVIDRLIPKLRARGALGIFGDQEAKWIGELDAQLDAVDLLLLDGKAEVALGVRTEIWKQTQRRVVLVEVHGLPTRLSVPGLQDLRVEAMEQRLHRLGGLSAVVVEQPRELRIRTRDAQEVVAQRRPIAHPGRTHDGGAVVEDELLDAGAMRGRLALDQFDGADLQHRRQHPAAVFVVAGHAECAGHVAAGERRENHTGAVPVKAPYDATPFIAQLRVALHLDLQTLLDAEAQFARQINGDGRCLHERRGIDRSHATQVFEFGRKRRMRGVDDAVAKQPAIGLRKQSHQQPARCARRLYDEAHHVVMSQ